ncbi:hypothetical protein DFP73DRAFT_530893 [Morchella snyderi]|nr:hypothetical protein DFP73DRAFT_530893 [Morchella snyderi]
MRQSIFFALVLSLFVFFVAAADISEYRDKNDRVTPKDWFNIKIRAPGNKYITNKGYTMDMKDGELGFGRPGAKKFRAYINGTEQGNSYLVTKDGFVFLQVDGAPLYDFIYGFVIPATDFKAYWSVEGGLLACHELTDGFKYFPDADGGYVIRWDTRESEGSPVQMIVV